MNLEISNTPARKSCSIELCLSEWRELSRSIEDQIANPVVVSKKKRRSLKPKIERRSITPEILAVDSEHRSRAGVHIGDLDAGIVLINVLV